MDTKLQQQLADWLSEHTQIPFFVEHAAAVHEGCIHQAYVLTGGDRSYFIKLNRASQLDVFDAEADGLKRIGESQKIRVPCPIGCGIIGSHSFLAMDQLTFGSASTMSWEKMGQQLADLHRSTAEQFGWPRDNYIGASPQSNQRTDNWVDFFCEQRLRPQCALAKRAGLRFEHIDRLFKAVATVLDGHAPPPSLLHGDLWSGNAGFLTDGTPVIYDPACYYGDRETDLAFSEVFGGFPSAFYTAYEAAWPLPAGYAERKELYNLYHILNHANLFGGGYIRQAQSMISSLVNDFS